jgi:hypothetical protein
MLAVLTSPRAAYADAAERRSWAAVFAVALAVSILMTSAFLATEIGRQALVDWAIRLVESFGGTVSDARYTQWQRWSESAPLWSAVAQLVGIPLLLMIVSGTIYMVFSVVMHGSARFAQVLAVTAYSGVVLAVRQVVAVPLAYMGETFSPPTTLAIFLPMLDDGSFASRVAGAVDLFRVWWLVSLAVGIGVLYRRRTTQVMWMLLAVYGAIALVLAAVQAMLTGA